MERVFIAPTACNRSLTWALHRHDLGDGQQDQAFNRHFARIFKRYWNVTPKRCHSATRR
ncbi:MAG TPA: hypothetical protein VEK79_01595 [Thermoanaerobaculia bacterium]|nr:hypothetical protein [Thermoanaerobaculia bacterium]